MANPAPFDEDLATKIAAMVRLLLSDKTGEAAAAAQMLPRTLRNAGTDVVNKVAELITSPFDENTPGNNGQLPEAVMKEVYAAGVEEGLKRARQSNINSTGTVAMPPARDMAAYCYQRLDALNDWERDFIVNITGVTRTLMGRPLSPKRQAHLEKIYLKLGGRI